MSSARILPAGSGRALGAAQVGLGLATIVRADDLATTRWLGLSAPAVARIVRVLGARQVVQGVVTGVRGDDPGTLIVGAAVDGLHAASMVPLAVLPGPYRRHALASAVLAGLAAVIGVAASEQ